MDKRASEAIAELQAMRENAKDALLSTGNDRYQGWLDACSSAIEVIRRNLGEPNPLEAENAALRGQVERLREACSSALPRLIETTRAYKHTFGEGHSQDFDSAIEGLRTALAETENI